MLRACPRAQKYPWMLLCAIPLLAILLLFPGCGENDKQEKAVAISFLTKFYTVSPQTASAFADASPSTVDAANDAFEPLMPTKIYARFTRYTEIAMECGRKGATITPSKINLTKMQSDNGTRFRFRVTVKVTLSGGAPQQVDEEGEIGVKMVDGDALIDDLYFTPDPLGRLLSPKT